MTDILSEANALFVDEQYEEALDLYNKAADSSSPPPTADVFFKRASCHAKLDDWKAVVKDCDRAIEMGFNDPKVHMRKGTALFELKLFDEAYKAMERGLDVGGDPSVFKTWIRKATAELNALKTNGKASYATTSVSKEEELKKEAVAASKSAVDNGGAGVDEPGPQTGAAQKGFKHEWYQNADYIVVSIVAKNVDRDDVSVEFSTQNVCVDIALGSGRTWTLDLDLCDEINAADSSYTVGKVKVELKLRKASPVRWEYLEKTTGAVKTRAWADTSKVNKASYPSSSKKKKDWDSLYAEVKKEEEEEKPEGDAALNKLFQDIYAKADEDTRRAMNKSFQESGGTVLSTNWKDVGKKRVEGSAPDGMEEKKYEY